MNTVCTVAALASLDPSGSVGYHTSVTFGADGLELISYYDFTARVLKVAHNVECTSATLSTIDSAGDVGLRLSRAPELRQRTLFGAE